MTSGEGKAHLGKNLDGGMGGSSSPSQEPLPVPPGMVLLPRISPARGVAGFILVLVGLGSLILTIYYGTIPNVHQEAALAVGFLLVFGGGALMGFVHGRKPPRPRRRSAHGAP